MLTRARWLRSCCRSYLIEGIALSLIDLKARLQIHRHWLMLGLSLALTTLTLYFALRGLDRHVLKDVLTAQNGNLLIAAAALIAVQINLGGMRWGTLISAMSSGRPPGLLSVLAIFYVSTFFNYLPLGTVGGDVARVWLARRYPLAVSQIVLSILLDRVLVIGALIILAVATLPSIAHPLATTTCFAGTAILIAGIVGFLLLRPIERLAGRWRDVWLVSSILWASEELRRTMHGAGLAALVYALLAAASGALAAYCISLSLGIDVGLMAMTAVMSFVAFATALPISVAGWGVREVSMVSLLGLLGVDREAALVLSIEFGIINTLICLPGGIIWLGLRNRRPLADSAKSS
jgi:glycosyltransferase 2 family protein